MFLRQYEPTWVAVEKMRNINFYYLFWDPFTVYALREVAIMTQESIYKNVILHVFLTPQKENIVARQLKAPMII